MGMIVVGIVFLGVVVGECAIFGASGFNPRISSTFTYSSNPITTQKNSYFQLYQPTQTYNPYQSNPYQTPPTPQTPVTQPFQQYPSPSPSPNTNPYTTNTNTNNNKNTLSELLQTKQQFEQFKAENNKYYYDPAEAMYRYNIFSDRLKSINLHNSGTGTMYVQGVTKFADLTKSQFQSRYLMSSIGAPPPPSATSSSSSQLSSPYLSSSSTPTMVIDWRSKGKVGMIRDQGSCGACYAFTVVGSIQSNIAILNNKMPDFYSVQQIVDCCRARGFDCYACNGGWPDFGYEYVNQYGLASAGNYPYAETRQACRDQAVEKKKYLNPDTPYIQVGGFASTLMYLSRGPVGVAVDASDWWMYLKGVMSCSPNVFYNHAALLVGYDGVNTWTIKNSWSTKWGEDGYIRIDARNDCGLTKHVYYPMVVMI